MPFDWKTPFGYAAAFIGQFAGFMIIGHNCACVLCLLCGFSWMTITFAEDIRIHLSNLNEQFKIDKSYAGVKVKIIAFIDFHSDIKS